VAGLLPLDFAFRAKYKVEVCWPEDIEYSKLPVCAFGPDGQREYDNGMQATLIIRPDEYDDWIVGLRGGYYSSEHVDGVYACPSPTCLLAVVDSYAYYIDCTKYGAVTRLELALIEKVYTSISYEMLFVMDNWSMIAFNAEGVAWSTKRLVVNALSITMVGEEEVYGCGDFHRDDENLFVLDRHTGKLLRGNMFCEK